MSDPAQDVPDPFAGKIGLALSGGGYRAAAFHLGALSYLDRLDLRSGIDTLSTVSGGTFTGARYVLSLLQGRPFTEFFRSFYAALEEIDLVEEALAILSSRENAVPSGRQDLIVSAAEVYARQLFAHRGPDGAEVPWYFGDVLTGELPIENVIFNATDFRTGIAFRFQRSRGNTALIGNYYHRVDPEDASDIRLADIVASSSCFPGGFEPISFPYDFTWRDGVIPDRVRTDFPERSSGGGLGPVPLMDGGVYDNQGLQSLLLADGRDEDDLDLVIISDVDQPSIELYEMPPTGSQGGMRLSTLWRLGHVGFALLALSVAALLTAAWQNWPQGELSVLRGTLTYLVPAALSGLSAALLWWIRRLVVRDVLPEVPELRTRAARLLGEITTGQLEQMITLRIGSVLTLTTTVFMKRIRALIYQSIYGPGGGRYDGKRISNLLYTLAPGKTRAPPVEGLSPSTPSPLLQKVACLAFDMPTTLWFEHAWQAPTLTAAGQASLCYNLLKSVGRRFGRDPAHFPPSVRARFDTLASDWQRFNEDPFFMLKDAGIEADWPAIVAEVERAEASWGMFTRTTPDREALL